MRKTISAVFIAILLVSCTGLLRAEVQGNCPINIQAPRDFTLTGKNSQGCSYYSEKEGVTLIIGLAGADKQAFSKQLKDKRFIKGLIDGLEGTGRIKVESHKVVEIEKIPAVEFSGKIDVSGDGRWSPQKRAMFSKGGQIYSISLIGPDKYIENQADLFSEVMQKL